MIATKIEYRKRLKEVECYLDTIKLLDKGECLIECIDINGEKHTKKVDSDLATILKANGFLILYNLIESTIRSSISAILSSMHSDMVTYKKISANLRDIWIGQEVKNITESSNLKAKVRSISELVLTESLLNFKSECIHISGNIDAQKVRCIAKQFGYEESQNGQCLHTIKEKRNKLAHGEYTFSDVGREYTSNDLIQFKNETVSFIDDVLNHVESYINDKKYMV